MSSIKEYGLEINKTLLSNPEAVYPPVSLASEILSEAQIICLDGLRKKIRNCCEKGNNDEAVRLADIANSIIAEGPPSKG